MKFTLQTVADSGARLGLLYEIGRHEELIIHTPAFFLYTKKGCVPHLSYDTLQLLSKGRAFPLILPLTEL